MSHKSVSRKQAEQESNRLSKPKKAAAVSTEQNPAASVKLSDEKSQLRYNPEHLRVRGQNTSQAPGGVSEC